MNVSGELLMGDDEVTNRQEMLVVVWSVVVVVVAVVFGVVILFMGRDEARDKKKLCNFDKAPRELVDDDSFILKEN